MSIPCVSVILPTYNRLGTLPRAVASVLGQTMPDLELIVVDDGSQDGTAGWLKTIEDSRLRVIRLPECKGAAYARNVGIRASRAALIAFQDSDDEWVPIKLERQLAVLSSSEPEVGFIGGAHRNGDRIVRSRNLERGVGYEPDLLAAEPFVAPAWLVRRKYLLDVGLFDESFPCLEDWDLLLKLAERCRFRGVEDVILIRYGSPDSLFGDLVKRKQGFHLLFIRHRAAWVQEPRLYAHWCTELSRIHGLHGELADGRRWSLEALRHDPLQWRAAVLLGLSFIHWRLLKRLSRTRYAVLSPPQIKS